MMLMPVVQLAVTNEHPFADGGMELTMTVAHTESTMMPNRMLMPAVHRAVTMVQPFADGGMAMKLIVPQTEVMMKPET